MSVLSAAADTPNAETGAAPSRPNVLLVVADDMGMMDVSVPFHHDAKGKPVITPLNRRYRTPNMEALAATGMKFTSAYACTVCTPSRTSLMTGLNATRHHVTTFTNVETPQDTGNPPKEHNLLPPAAWKKGGIDPGSQTLPRLLRNAGYRTIHVGKAHFGPNSKPIGDPRSIGFDVNIAGCGLGSPGSYLGKQNFMKNQPSRQVPGLSAYHGQDIFLTEALTREMSREIGRAADDGTPFFAYLSHYAVHAPFEDPDPRFVANYPKLSDRQKSFATLVEGVDKSLGDLLKKLRDLGVAENTLVVVLGDNGTDAPIPFGPGQIGPAAPYRGKKGHAYEGGLRIPLIVSWAQRNEANPLQKKLPIPAAGACHDLVAIWDIFPTLLSVAGTKAAEAVDGHDLSPYLRGEPGTHRPQEFLLNFPHSHQYEDFYAVMRQNQWKLIYRYKTREYELYDLASDIGEQNDLSAKPAHAGRLTELAGLMISGLRELGYQPPRDRLADGRPETPVVMPGSPGSDDGRNRSD